MGLKARIWASRLGFGPRGWDLGLETGICASGLEFEWGLTEEKEEKEKFSLCVKAYVIDPFGAAALLPLQFQAQPN